MIQKLCKKLKWDGAITEEVFLSIRMILLDIA